MGPGSCDPRRIEIAGYIGNVRTLGLRSTVSVRLPSTREYILTYYLLVAGRCRGWGCAVIADEALLPSIALCGYMTLTDWQQKDHQGYRHGQRYMDLDADGAARPWQPAAAGLRCLPV